ncbi:unnamed protein product [Anisakis simplex]|uniref:Secreted protein n=1 Tax=Anisakis simplex TaxID=6269 RepID=A0A0M3JR66_ANISI|nr:unnamed protein product [Anisakis simplex]
MKLEVVLFIALVIDASFVHADDSTQQPTNEKKLGTTELENDSVERSIMKILFSRRPIPHIALTLSEQLLTAQLETGIADKEDESPSPPKVKNLFNGKESFTFTIFDQKIQIPLPKITWTWEGLGTGSDQIMKKLRKDPSIRTYAVIAANIIGLVIFYFVLFVANIYLHLKHRRAIAAAINDKPLLKRSRSNRFTATLQNASRTQRHTSMIKLDSDALGSSHPGDIRLEQDSLVSEVFDSTPVPNSSGSAPQHSSGHQRDIVADVHHETNEPIDRSHIERPRTSSNQSDNDENNANNTILSDALQQHPNESSRSMAYHNTSSSLNEPVLPRDYEHGRTEPI